MLPTIPPVPWPNGKNLRVTLRNEPSRNFSDSEVDANLTGNHAIELAQKYIVTAFTTLAPN